MTANETTSAAPIPPLSHSVLDLIGNTPMLELNQIKKSQGFEGRIFAKLELNNPGGSKKDRVALSMIRVAKANGKLAEGQPVVEVTSGNTGTGLSIVCGAGSSFLRGDERRQHARTCSDDAGAGSSCGAGRTGPGITSGTSYRAGYEAGESQGRQRGGGTESLLRRSI